MGSKITLTFVVDVKLVFYREIDDELLTPSLP